MGVPFLFAVIFINEVKNLIRKILREVDFDWVDNVSPMNTDEQLPIMDLVPHLEDALDGTRFFIEFDDEEGTVDVRDFSGVYTSYRDDISTSIQNISDEIKETVKNKLQYSITLRDEYRDLLQVINNHFNI